MSRHGSHPLHAASRPGIRDKYGLWISHGVVPNVFSTQGNVGYSVSGALTFRFVYIVILFLCDSRAIFFLFVCEEGEGIKSFSYPTIFWRMLKLCSTAL